MGEILITVIGSIVVALITSSTNKKIDTIKEIKETILSEVEKTRVGYEKAIKEHIIEDDKNKAKKTEYLR